MAEAAGTAQAEGNTAPQAGKRRSRSSNNQQKNTTPAKTTKNPMSDEHKANLALGRQQGRIVSDYLDAIEAHKPKRGRKVTRATMEERLRKLKEETIPQATGAHRLSAIQERIDLENALAQSPQDTDQVAELQAAFVKVAKEYANRKGFTVAAFREAGVPAAVLKEAGLTRKSA